MALGVCDVRPSGRESGQSRVFRCAQCLPSPASPPVADGPPRFHLILVHCWHDTSFSPQGVRLDCKNFNPGQISNQPKSVEVLKEEQERIRQTLKDKDAPRRNLSPRKQRRRSIDTQAGPAAQQARQVTCLAKHTI